METLLLKLTPILGVLLVMACDRVPPRKEASLAACEKLIGERLKSPSSYKRISVTTDEQPYTATWQQAQKRAVGGPDFSNGSPKERALAAELLAIYERMEKSNEYSIFSAVIEYDASNSYGVPLRTQSLCEAIIRTTDKGYEISEAYVDKMTSLDFALSRLRN